MKSKNPKESIFKKKGFYAALYSSLGVVMVLAAVVSFNNLSALNKPAQNKAAVQGVDFTELEPTGTSPESIATQEDLTAAKKQQTAQPGTTAPSSAPKQNTTPNSGTSQKQDATPSPGAAPVPKPSTQGTTGEADAVPKANTPQQNPVPAPSQETKTPNTVGEAEADDYYDTAYVDEEDTEPVFSAYTDDSRMVWPVLGEVVMDYSDSHAIYDKTLDQYRTNDTLCIGAELGSQVVASAEGLVVKLTHTKENGNTVVIDHGNGWTTTYSQLQDGVLVKEGDVVRKGQVIGGVSSPSIYSVLLGNHMGFKVSKDNEPVNPMSVLE